MAAVWSRVLQFRGQQCEHICQSEMNEWTDLLQFNGSSVNSCTAIQGQKWERLYCNSRAEVYTHELQFKHTLSELMYYISRFAVNSYATVQKQQFTRVLHCCNCSAKYLIVMSKTGSPWIYYPIKPTLRHSDCYLTINTSTIVFVWKSRIVLHIKTYFYNHAVN